MPDQEWWITEVRRLRAENDALAKAHRSIWAYLNISGDETHVRFGEACGEDLCIVCLAKETAKAAVSRAQDAKAGR